MPGLLGAAVVDNVRWVRAVATAHGVRSHADDTLWAATAPTPPGYPEVVTLRPGCGRGQVARALDGLGAGVSVKDSFADVDLSADGFALLLDGRWVGAAAVGTEAAARLVADLPALPWWEVVDEVGLEAWRRAWRGDAPEQPGVGGADGGGDHGEAPADPFLPDLLRERAVTLLAGGPRERPTSVAVASTGGPAVGLSNIVGADGVVVRLHLRALAARQWPGRPVVGWEAGPALTDALAAGMSSLGPVRVWVRA